MKKCVCVWGVKILLSSFQWVLAGGGGGGGGVTPIVWATEDVPLILELIFHQN